MSPSAKPSQQEEDDFIRILLDGIDETFFDVAPSPPRKPSPKAQVTATNDASFQEEIKQESSDVKLDNSDTYGGYKAADPVVRSVAVEDVDLEALCEGADEWDWGDMDIGEDKVPFLVKVC